MFAVMPAIQSDNNLLDIITICGARGSLELCLDAGDALSAPSGTTTWDDVSGNGRTYNKAGSTAVVTFTGTVGDKRDTTYWEFNINSHWAPASATSWDDGFHKNNGKFSVVTVALFSNAGTDQGLWGNDAFGFGGVGARINTSDDPEYCIDTTTGTVTGSPTVDVQFFNGFTWDEANDAVSILAALGNSAEDDTAFPAMSSVTNPSANWTVAANRDNGTGRGYIGGGARMWVHATWSTKLAWGQLQSIRAYLRVRFPSMQV